MAIFLRLRDLLYIENLKNVYYGSTQSLIIYELSVLSGCFETLMHTLNVAQKGFLKIISRKPRSYRSIQIFKNADILTKNKYLKK